MMRRIRLKSLAVMAAVAACAVAAPAAASDTGGTVAVISDGESAGAVAVVPSGAVTAVGTAAANVSRAITITDPARFINRELSWLRFDERVIEESCNVRQPLSERVRFLAISSTNLDEFDMVRVAGLKGQALAGLSSTSADGLTPAQQLLAINRRAGALVRTQQRIWRELKVELASVGVHVVLQEQLTEEDRRWLRAHFDDFLFPQLTPMSIDPAQ